jgi:hypothetical protein
MLSFFQGGRSLPLIMDPDSDPDRAIFVIDLQDVNKKLIKKKILLITF